MTIKISNIRAIGWDAPIEVECPLCDHKNHYIVHPQEKFTVQRPCYKCGAILLFDCEEDSDD